MRKYHVQLLALMLTSVAALAAANAADMYPAGPGGYKDGPVVQTWTGFYAGAYFGGIRDNGKITLKDDDPAESSSERSNGSGAFGGGTLGYNFQRGHFVFGPEIDLGGMDIKAKKSFRNDPPDFGSISSGFTGDFTGRLGYTTGPLLFYAKAGGAFYDADFKTNEDPIITKKTDTLWGWTAGAGVEYLVNRSWSIKAEYLHFDFGSTSIFDGADTTKFQPRVDSVKAGVNYHILPGYEPLK
jgi:outer membrane immunogenic protein